MNSAENKEGNFLIQLIIPLYFGLLLAKFYFAERIPILSTLLTVSFVSLGFFTLLFVITKFKKNALIPNFIFLLLLCIVSTFPLSENYRIFDLFLVVNYLGIGLLPLFYNLNFKLYRVFAFLCVLFFIPYIVTGVGPSEIFAVSRNFISVVLLIGIGYHMISCVQNDKNVNFLLILLGLFISLWAIGRSGIAVFAILLLTVPFISNYRFIYKLLLLTLILVAGIYAFNIFSDTLFKTALYRIERSGGEEERTTMNQEYLDVTFSSLKNILFGTNLHEIESLKEVDYNPHNSFIRLHIYYGLIGFISIISLICYAFKDYLFTKNRLYFLLLFVLLFRSAVDSTAFHGPLDPLIFSLLFVPIFRFKLIEHWKYKNQISLKN